MSGYSCRICKGETSDAVVCYLCVEGDLDGLSTKHHGPWCDRCVGDDRRHPSLMRNLGDIDGLSRALVDVFSRMTRRGDNGGSRSAERPLPFDPRASDAADTLRNTLTTWVRELDAGDLPDDDASTPALARWLMARLERIRQHPAADEIVRDVDRAVRDAAKAVDLVPERWYAGPCDEPDEGGVKCPGELYANVGAASVRCPVCGLIWDVQARRKWLLASAEGVLATASEVSSALTSWGQPVTPERVRQWAARGQLPVHGIDLRGHPTYRIGEVMDLLKREIERKERIEQAKRTRNATRTKSA